MDTIMWAIKNGDLDQLKSICETQTFDVNTELSKRYPIHIAADYGQSDVLTFLLAKGANANQIDQHGITPLLAAIWEGHTECVRVLLAHGAAKVGTTPDGVSYIEAAEKDEIKALLA